MAGRRFLSFWGNSLGLFAEKNAVSSRNRSRAPQDLTPQKPGLKAHPTENHKNEETFLRNPKGSVKLLLLYPFIVQIMSKEKRTHTHKNLTSCLSEMGLNQNLSATFNYRFSSSKKTHLPEMHWRDWRGLRCWRCQTFPCGSLQDVSLRSLLSFPCKWVTRIITLFIGVITPFIASDGGPYTFPWFSHI